MMPKYCVIAMAVNSYNKVPRRWTDTEEEAIQHASEIIRRQDDNNLTLVVVEAKCTVQRKVDFDVIPIREDRDQWWSR